ncbi:hypothetical protein [Pseudarthrobacter sp. PH31-O2]|uniref:hypothetical protein n=1 Tax=Pseudarthrobacter sp. PH31-O2 TaxID=3046206 RepID=UPI0024B9185B|nr:hypothetical protein [Pseudarthrobacter sp. PH31-O2]MDJ0352521.1 hypothetical protein [Pseudarthrobacter sp. PH31-O2]
MKKKLQRLLQLSLNPGPRRKTQFNGPLLDQKREDVFLTMHRIGFIRWGRFAPSKEDLVPDNGTDPQGAHAATRGLPR